MAQFSRLVDAALREVLPGQGVPLVLAATEPLGSVFRAHCRYPDLVPQSVPGNPEGRGDVEMVAASREVLDRWYAERLEDEKQTFETRSHQGRTSTDLAALARFATQGAVDTLFVDIDATVAGDVDELRTVTFATPEAGRSGGDLVDEIARRAWLTGARLLALRREDMPEGADIAATLRYVPLA